MKYKVFCIVVTYNGEKWIKKCLRSLKDCTQDVTTVVIDNGSADNTISIIEDYFPEVLLIQAEKNLGFGQANNIGLRRAIEDNADYVFLLNQDAWIEPDTLSKLIKAHQAYPKYGVISPLHLEGTGTKLDYNFAKFISPDKSFDLFSDLVSLERDKLEMIYEVPFVNAALWLIPDNTLKTIGGFDPLFFHYREDRDFVNRLWFHELKLGVVPEAKGYHDRPQKDSNRKKRMLKDSLKLMHYTNPSKVFRNHYILVDHFILMLKELLRLRLKEVNRLFKQCISLYLILPKIKNSRVKKSKRQPNFL